MKTYGNEIRIEPLYMYERIHINLFDSIEAIFVRSVAEAFWPIYAGMRNL